MLKKVTVALALTGLMAGAAFAGTIAGTGINGSLHDMNTYAGAAADAYGRTCAFCHTPHNAVTLTSAPLWNRKDTTIPPQTYVWIAPANDLLKATALKQTDPLAGPSRLCASCHDGSVAVDSHLTAGPATGSKFLTTGTGNGMVDLSMTHPIGFDYLAAQAQTGRGSAELRVAGTVFLGPIATSTGFNTKSPTAGTGTVKIEDRLFVSGAEKMMTCASCHEVHNTNNYNPGDGSYNYFLLAAQQGSALCVTCHVK